MTLAHAASFVRSSRPRLLVGTAVGLLVVVTAMLGVSARASRAAASDEETIWNYEQSIYAGRAKGDLSFYVDHADLAYAAWPPQMKAPMDYASLAASGKNAAGIAGEKLTMEKNLIRISRDGKVGLSYYTTHRTNRAGGAAVDESFENIHVWIKDAKGWHILGGMSRPVPPHRESLGSTVLPGKSPAK